MSSPEQPTRGSGQPPSDGDDATRSDSSSSTELGSFISSSVKNSFRQLKRDSELAKKSESPETAETTPAPSGLRRRRTDSPSEQAPPVRSGPVGRKWRDAIAPSLSQNDQRSEFEEGDESETSETRFDLGGWFRETFFDENGPTRKLFAAIAVLIIAILIIIYLMAQGGDGNGGDDDPTETPTTNVISTDRTSTPSDDDQVTPTRRPNQETPEVTPTDGVQQGGDNQKD